MACIRPQTGAGPLGKLNQRCFLLALILFFQINKRLYFIGAYIYVYRHICVCMYVVCLDRKGLNTCELKETHTHCESLDTTSLQQRRIDQVSRAMSVPSGPGWVPTSEFKFEREEKHIITYIRILLYKHTYIRRYIPTCEYPSELLQEKYISIPSHMVLHTREVRA